MAGGLEGGGEALAVAGARPAFPADQRQCEDRADQHWPEAVGDETDRDRHHEHRFTEHESDEGGLVEEQPGLVLDLCGTAAGLEWFRAEPGDLAVRVGADGEGQGCQLQAAGKSPMPSAPRTNHSTRAIIGTGKSRPSSVMVIDSAAGGGSVQRCGHAADASGSRCHPERSHCRRKVAAASQIVELKTFLNFFPRSCNTGQGCSDRTSEPGGCPDPRADSHQAYSRPRPFWPAPDVCADTAIS